MKKCQDERSSVGRPLVLRVLIIAEAQRSHASFSYFSKSGSEFESASYILLSAQDQGLLDWTLGEVCRLEIDGYPLDVLGKLLPFTTVQDTAINSSCVCWVCNHTSIHSSVNMSNLMIQRAGEIHLKPSYIYVNKSKKALRKFRDPECAKLQQKLPPCVSCSGKDVVFQKTQ